MKIIYISILLSISVSFYSCSKIAESTVKNGAFDACNNSTVSHLIEKYFDNPKWESFVADDGNTYVNVIGGITYDGKPVKALLQFYVDGDRFEIYSFKINNIAQNDYMVMTLITDMCGISSNSQGNSEASSTSGIDGDYIYDDNSGKIEINIIGNTWYGNTTMKSGFGADYDSQNAIYQNGTLQGNDLYDETGFVKIGYVNGSTLITSIGGNNVTLQKN
jgi:hypothetical protein